ncbi:MAG: 4-hydroxythreonine-4-phosphate dehydrogenase PdxA [Acidobacteriota bacterium]|nr:4-hydroxythreonine-4-phosphate dehydrogenase PdxA [Acidobacteriota bacterium]
MALPVIAITVGDPAGIGPEIARKAAAAPSVIACCRPVLYGPWREDALGAFPAGTPTAASGQSAYEAIDSAVRDAREGKVAAIATGPVSKEALAMAGYPWKGHTDLLAHLTGASRVAMMFWSPRLRVVLATVHLPLSEVPAALTAEKLRDAVELSHLELPKFGVPSPRIGVAALNPHAGEGGLMGHEEDSVMRPAIAAMRTEGIDVTGPFPADTLFVRAARGEFDVIVAAYHDQGLIPVKLLGFGAAVNVTLGLPIIRTSVDHGTAYDIAGKNQADEGSLIEAVMLAARLAGGPLPPPTHRIGP